MRTGAALTIALAIALSAGISGCRKRVAPPPPPPPPPPAAKVVVAPARIAEFASDQEGIARGDTAILRWRTTDAASVTIEPGIGPVPPEGSITVSPSRTTTYRLTAIGPGGRDVRELAVEVHVPRIESVEALPPPPPPPRRPPPKMGPAPPSRDVSAGSSPPPRSDPAPPLTGTPSSDIRRLVVLRAPEPPIPADRMTALDKELAALPAGAFLFVPPVSPQPGSTARLFVDVNPLFVTSQEELRTALAEPGVRQGEPAKVSGAMRAGLTGANVRIRRVFPPPDAGEQRLSSSRPAQWIWVIEIEGDGPPELVLDLQARAPASGQWVPVHPPIAHTWDKPPPPPPPDKPKPSDESAAMPPPFGSWSNLLIVVLLLVIAAAAASAVTLRLSRGRAATPPPEQHATGAALSAIPPAGAALKTRVVVIHGRDERSEAEKFCTALGATRCEFIYALPGFAEDSIEWRRHFLDAYASADAVLVLLTGAALLESGVNWKIEHVMSRQGVRQLPVYPVVLDPQVTRAASTLARLADRAWFKGAAPEDVSEVGEILNELEPSILRSVRCFISYSRKDGVELADRLIADLAARGIRCWRDTADIPGGAKWMEEIAGAISNSTHVLFLITAKSLESPHVEFEVTSAKQAGRVVIPLLCQQGPPPFGFHSIQIIPLYAGYEDGLERLIRDISTPRAGAQTGAA